MPLPSKTVEMTYRASHLVRTLPAKLEMWMNENGYVIRLLSKDDGMASILSPEQCNPLHHDDLPKDAKLRKLLLGDIRGAQFVEKPDGTFERGDVRLYVQTLAARDHMREIRKLDREKQESVEAVYEQVDDMNQQLAGESKGGVVPGFVTADPNKVPANIPSPAVAPVGAHASGGSKEVARSMSLMERIEQANEAAR